MKVLWLTDFFPQSNKAEITGGVEARCFYVSKYLTSKNIKVKIIARKTSGNVWHPPSLLSIPERLIFTARSLIEGLNSDFDLVEGTNFATFPVAWILGMVKRKPIIFWYPDIFLGSWTQNAGPISGMIGEISESAILKLPITKYIAISEATKKKLTSHGVNENKISVVYCGIDEDEIEKAGRMKTEFDVSAVSRLLPYKHLEDLINAAKLLDLKVAIVGRGPEKERLLKIASPQIKFIDYLPSHLDVFKLIKSSRIFCHPSIVEGFGISIVEAMALGKPVVVSDLPVLHETTANKGALFFKPKNVVDLARKLKKLLTDKKLYKLLAKQGSQRARVLTWTKVGAQTQKIYENLLKPKPKICITTDSWRPLWGGGQEHVWQLAWILVQDYGYQIDILVPNLLDKNGYERKREELYQDSNLRVLRLGPAFTFPNLFGRSLYLFSILQSQLSNRYDIYNSHASDAVLLPIVKLFHPRSKFLYTLHGTGIEMLGAEIINNFNLLPKIWNLLMSKFPFDGVVSAAKSTIPKQIASKKLLIVGNGVNVEEYDSVRTPAKKKKQFKIIWVGRRDDPVKGVRFLEKAFQMVKKKYPAVVLEIVTNKYGVDKIQAYKSSDLFVLPSLSEGLPLVLLEAMAAKLPIVTTDVGDCAELIRKSKSGIIVSPGSSAALYEGIVQMLMSKQRQTFGKRGHDFVKKHYTWQRIAKKYDQLFKKLA